MPPDHDDLPIQIDGLRIRVDKLEGHVRANVDPVLDRLEADMTEMRQDLRLMGVKIDSCATKDDVISIMRKIDDGNANLATALETPSKAQDKSTLWIAIASLVVLAATAILAIHH
jgi:hypothetical protein